jgi:hypothetical protein
MAAVRRVLETVLLAAAALVRLFARSRQAQLIAGALLIVATSFTISLWAIDAFLPGAGTASRTAAGAAQLPPLKPVTRTSYADAPVAIAHSAIRAALDKAAPRNLAGKNDNPVSEILSKADIGITVARGAMAVGGNAGALTISTPLNGNLRVTGQIASKAGDITGSIGGLINSSIGKKVGGLTGKVLDQRAEVRGNVAVTSRPAITPNWRIEPNLTGQVSLGDSALQLAGFKINVASEVKPLIDRAVNDQIGSLQSRLRNDPMLEQTARREWAKMCRAIPLGGGNTGLPALWLEMRPTRAFAAQPRIDASAVTLTVGVQAETRIVPTQTKPNCPFPARLEILAAKNEGRVAIGVPIDMPFTHVNKLLEAQLKDKRFPEDGSGAFEVLVRRATVAAYGERLLISLHVKASERKSWFGFGADATVHVIGKPVLDRENQIMRLTGISLSVESDAVFGLLGAAARAAIPYVQDALAQSAVVDLKPFAADARAKIGAAIAEFRQNSEGVRVDAAVTELKLEAIEFDSATLRIVAEAGGTVKVAVSQLPGM